MSANVLVTGGSSALGAYVVDALTDRGDFVVSYDHPHARRRTDAAVVVSGEVFDLPRLLHIIREHEVGRIVHAADVSSAGVSIDMPVATVVLNVEATLHLLEAARLAEVVGRIVLLSSRHVYGDRDEAVVETAPLRPSTPYGIAKVTAELLGTVYSTLYGLDVLSLRLGDPYGPELGLPTVVDSFVQSAAIGEPLSIPSGADQRFQLTHGEDISRAVLAALDSSDVTQRIFNITGGETHSLAQIGALIEQRFPESVIEIGPGTLPCHDQQGALDIRAADSALGFRPIWGLARGIDDYADWLLARREAA